MKKTLYSLMLSDEVIREIDLLAHRMGTNRSNLVNMILAEHVQLRTPEQRVNDIFNAIEELMVDSRELVPSLTPNAPYMELRSCLEYKYRPTVRYEVELRHTAEPSQPIGLLSVIFRTQSAGLIEALTIFFNCWKSIEDSLLPIPREYSLEDGRFTRTLAYPTANGKSAMELSAKQLAGVIADYIRLLDRLLKAYVAGNLSEAGVASEYRAQLQSRQVLI